MFLMLFVAANVATETPVCLEILFNVSPLFTVYDEPVVEDVAGDDCDEALF